jgi:hypothetical protein
MNLRSRLTNVFLAATAGLAGGLVPHFLLVEPGRAQAAVLPEESKIIRAQQFSVVNEQGKVVGTLGVGRDGKAEIILYDAGGRTIWSTRAGVIPIVK